MGKNTYEKEKKTAQSSGFFLAYILLGSSIPKSDILCCKINDTSLKVLFLNRVVPHLLRLEC